MNQRIDLLNQETELLILAAFLPNIEPTFVDVGAERGGFSHWMTQHRFTGFAIEPMAKHAAALRELALGGAVKFLPCAVDSEDGTRALHIATDVEGQPLDHFHSLERLADDTRVHHTQAVQVVCRSLASLRAEGSLPARIGLLKIDTEGNDLSVLRGMAPFEAEILMVEYFTTGLYAGWADADPLKLITQAESLGYAHCIAIRRTLSGLEIVTYQPLSFQPGEWGNLIFLRESSYPTLRTVLAGLFNEHRTASGMIAFADAAFVPNEAMPTTSPEFHAQPATEPLQREITELRRVCKERLDLIEFLHHEAARRLDLIHELDHQLHPPATP